MSISNALTNALSGLTASARSAQVVSSNIANASTEGYARRSLSQSASVYGFSGGVRLDGVTRHANPVAVAERRLADAGSQFATGTNSFYSRLERVLGTPDSADSLSGVMATFESTLATATGAPDSDIRLKNIALDAENIVKKFNVASDDIQTMRSDADSNISKMIDDLNGLLEQTQDMNRKIFRAMSSGQETAGLEDARGLLIDRIGELVPVRLAPRDNGAVALYTTTGATLLDGTAVEVSFNESSIIEPHMTYAAGLLSGVEINGRPVRIDSERGALAGGAIGAQFAIRDELGVEAQADLDAAARSLVERFQNTTTDPTLTAGDPGLFTDAGAAFATSDEVGLAGRLELNNLVDLDGAGETWRLRDGLGAAAPGDAGDATQLNRMLDVMQEQIAPPSGSFGPKTVSMTELSGKLLSNVSGARVTSDRDLAFANSQLASLENLELQDGVDTDQELQRLMLIEQAYAANARLIQAADEMLDSLMRL
ncbi:flagellar hook-associated protein FlgK [Shimia sp. MMG029]|uniref:flagellar hook-associated protein FlgK n=1 Tax=Shimia sp. MMG029 TaxID=3021978 RepID=UPI0022FEB499|nr:flagellar hook-associated protein FlgK [Shimia sp. MMG029]MDA5557599.1 flagellar hook-associated protein FlgK [Shimia sp. MMG029]